MSDPVIASVGDAIVRQSDLKLLSPPNWLNDRIISFYFEYLYENVFTTERQKAQICFISPEVSQFIKLASSSAEVGMFIEPLMLEDKKAGWSDFPDRL